MLVLLIPLLKGWTAWYNGIENSQHQKYYGEVFGVIGSSKYGPTLAIEDKKWNINQSLDYPGGVL